MSTIDWQSLNVYVSGRFDGFKKEELNALILGQGARVAGSFPSSNAILTSDPEGPKVAKAIEKGKTILQLDDLGGSLEGYLERMQGALKAFQEQFADYRKKMVYHLAAGAPADEALMTRVEEAIGFPLPDDLRTLMGQFNGLSMVGAEIKRKAEAPSFPETVLPYATLADMSHPLYAAAHDATALSTIGIPSWSDIFLQPAKARLTGESCYGPKEKLKIGTLKVGATEFYERLYPFDIFHPYHGAALYADPKDQTVKVIYASDHWAALTSAHPVPLRIYMESLIAMVSHKGSFYEQRIIKPTSKTAWPTYIKNIHGGAYLFLETRGG
ncbi:MAG: BRCT domain-containing protein [Bradymonadia bacterium]